MRINRLPEQGQRRADGMHGNMGKAADIQRCGAGQVIDVKSGVGHGLDLGEQIVFKNQIAINVIGIADAVVFARVRKIVLNGKGVQQLLGESDVVGCLCICRLPQQNAPLPGRHVCHCRLLRPQVNSHGGGGDVGQARIQGMVAGAVAAEILGIAAHAQQPPQAALP